MGSATVGMRVCPHLPATTPPTDVGLFLAYLHQERAQLQAPCDSRSDHARVSPLASLHRRYSCRYRAHSYIPFPSHLHVSQRRSRASLPRGLHTQLLRPLREHDLLLSKQRTSRSQPPERRTTWLSAPPWLGSLCSRSAEDMGPSKTRKRLGEGVRMRWL